MAQKLNRILLPLISPRVGEVEHDHAIALHTPNTTLSHELGVEDKAYKAAVGMMQPEFVRYWIKELKVIFEKALDMRRIMEYHGGRFSWSFPQPGTRFRDAIMTDAHGEAAKAKDGITKARRVFLTLAPSVAVSDQFTYAGEYEPEVLACPATVVVWTPKAAAGKSSTETK